MSALVVPRYELPIIDPATGRMSREWYKFLALMASSVGDSTSLEDDLETDTNSQAAALESIALKALQRASNAESLIFYGQDDLPKPQDLSLLAFWPGNAI